MSIPSQYLAFKDEQPELTGAFEELSAACKAAGPLDKKMIALCKLGIAIGAGMEGATHSATRKAMAAGCSREEMLHVAMLSTTTLGFPAMMRARCWVLDEVEK